MLCPAVSSSEGEVEPQPEAEVETEAAAEAQPLSSAQLSAIQLSSARLDSARLSSSQPSPVQQEVECNVRGRLRGRHPLHKIFKEWDANEWRWEFRRNS